MVGARGFEPPASWSRTIRVACFLSLTNTRKSYKHANPVHLSESWVGFWVGLCLKGEKVKEKPILFSGPMVRALLENRKSQTRRVVKYPFEVLGPAVRFVCDGYFTNSSGYSFEIWAPNRVGDRLWVRETWCPCVHGSYEPWYRHLKSPERQTDAFIQYRSDGHGDEYDGYWRPSIFMPRWASRLTLEVTGVRAERLQDISEADARAEGALWVPGHGSITPLELECDPGYSMYLNCREGFECLWSTIHKADGPHGWAANPWVWMYEFRRVAK